MSSDYQPSFRAAFKNKINKVFKSNITSSIRERIISNDTYHAIRDKSRNLTDTIIDRTHLGTLINKTKGFINPKNETLSKGFYDSLFSPQSENDVYIKVTVICLWVIALLCIIPTIITIFIPVRDERIKTTGVKMIFFHIFLCEFCYLIYILLSMINVALGYHMSSVICDFANYGMYITVPVMHLALLFLAFERITKYCRAAGAWTKIFRTAWITQLIFAFIWLILIAVILTIMFIKNEFSTMSVIKKAKSFIPASVIGGIDSFIPPYRCSIDGRLSPIFKVLFIILFVVLLALIIKSMAISIFYKFSSSNCCGRNERKDNAEQANRHITLLFIIFLLLNLFLSFPFYIVSMGDSIIRHFVSIKDTFTMRLKICFILRLSSIILQCLIFYTFESKSWHFLRISIYKMTCKKFSILNDDDVQEKKPAADKPLRKIKRTRTATREKPVTRTPSRKTNPVINQTSPEDTGTDDDRKATINKQSRKANGLNNHIKLQTIPKIVNKNIGEKCDSESVSTVDSDDNDVFPQESRKTVKGVSDQDARIDEASSKPKPKLSIPKKDSTDNPRQKKDETEEQKVLLRRPISKNSNTNGLSKEIPNGKPISQRISSTTTNPKTSKSNTEQNHTKHLSNQSSSGSDLSVDNSDDDIKPIDHSSHHRRHRTNPSHVSEPITITSNKQVQRNTDNHTKKPKQDRLSKMIQESNDV